MSFSQVVASARQQGFEIRVFLLLSELPKAIEPHLPVCWFCRWKLGPFMWSSPTTMSLDPIVVAPFGGLPMGEAADPPHVDLPAIVRSQRRGQRRLQGKAQSTNIYACHFYQVTNRPLSQAVQVV